MGRRTTRSRDDGAISVFENDAVLPAQWFNRPGGGSYTGERALCCAILEEACGTLKKTRGIDAPKARVLHEEARAWVLADAQPDDTFAFPYVCQVLGLEPDVVRAALVKVDWAPPWKFTMAQDTRDRSYRRRRVAMAAA